MSEEPVAWSNIFVCVIPLLRPGRTCLGLAQESEIWKIYGRHQVSNMEDMWLPPGQEYGIYMVATRSGIWKIYDRHQVRIWKILYMVATRSGIWKINSFLPVRNMENMWLPPGQKYGRYVVSTRSGIWKIFGYHQVGNMEDIWFPSSQAYGRYVVTNRSGIWKICMWFPPVKECGR